MSGTTETVKSTFEREMENPEFKAEFEKEVKIEDLSDEELKSKIIDLQEEDNQKRLLSIEAVRALHPSRILKPKELEALMSLKEEELTDADRSRMQLATLRLKHHRYTGTGYSAKEKQKVRAKRKRAKLSRKANR